MIGQVTMDFATLIMITESIEDGLKNGKMTDIEGLQTMVERQSRNTYKKVQVNGRKNEGRKEGEVNIVYSQVARNSPSVHITLQLVLLLTLLTNCHHLSMLIDQCDLSLLLTYNINKARTVLEIQGLQIPKESLSHCVNQFPLCFQSS